jgi:PDZ domain
MLKKLSYLFLFGMLSLPAFAAENLYAKHYKAQNDGHLASMQASPDTQMYVSNHQDEDNISMLENGFDMMGTSGFEAGDVPAELALQHGRSIKADTVLVYSKYASKSTGASKIQLIKEAAKTGKELTEQDVKEAPEQYKYYASYWAKLPPPLLGVHIVKLTQIEDDKRIPLNGLRVLAVIKGSPAEKAGLQRGDMLTKIGTVVLNKPEELSAVVAQMQGQKVAIEYERNEAKAVTTAQINRR